MPAPRCLLAARARPLSPPRGMRASAFAAQTGHPRAACRCSPTHISARSPHSPRASPF